MSAEDDELVGTERRGCSLGERSPFTTRQLFGATRELHALGRGGFGDLETVIIRGTKGIDTMIIYRGCKGMSSRVFHTSRLVFCLASGLPRLVTAKSCEEQLDQGAIKVN